MAKRILVVDDEWAVLELVKTKLAKRGFKVMTARNVKELWNFAFSKKPDLLILDIWLDNGCTGTQVYEEILKAGFDSRIPVIFVSALVDEGRPPKRAPEGGRFALFGKPFDFKVMLDEIYRFIGKPASSVLNGTEEKGGGSHERS